MKIKVVFHSYFKDLTGCANATEDLPAGSNIASLLAKLYQRFPRLMEMKKSTLIAVGVEYQKSDFKLSDGDEVSLFPPVQGG